MIGNITAGIYGVGVAPSTNSYESIATANGTGSSNSITFSSIPSTYKHLQIRFIAKTTSSGSGSDTTIITINGNTITKNHYLYGGGSSAAAGVGGAGDVNNTPKSGYTNIFSGEIIDILDYTSTTNNKTIRSLGGYDANGAGEIALYSNLYATNTNPITIITLTASAGNFAQYSSFALYGIKDS
jgi:hypothetical protein